jgi:hypothetical protein
MSKLSTLSSEVHSIIVRYLSIKDLLRLYQTCNYWRHKINNEKLLWRGLYKQMFGYDFTRDRWILWAIRRLWSQSTSEEKRLAAQRVNLISLEHLDGYSWYRLVRGRYLTEKNWLHNTPQRSIFFPKMSLKVVDCDRTYIDNNLTYGTAFISRHNRIGFGIVDDTLNDTRQIHLSDIRTNYPLPSDTHQRDMVLGKVVLSDWTALGVYFDEHLSSEEFLVAHRFVTKGEQAPQLIAQAIFVWDIGNLVIHHINDRPCYVPRLCMIELMPETKWRLLMQHSGWLLIKNMISYMDESTQKQQSQYILYDIRRGRLAASFAMNPTLEPVIGKATPDRVEIYHGYIIPMSNTRSNTEEAPVVGHQYHWHVIEIGTRVDIQPPDVDLTLCNQGPSSEILERLKEKYNNIHDCVRKQTYWHDKGYWIREKMGNDNIQLPKYREAEVQLHYLTDNMFCISYKNKSSDYGILLVHSSHGQRIIWSRYNLNFGTFIPEEKSILTTTLNSRVELLDIYTGNVLRYFNDQTLESVQHIIGRICCYSSDNVRSLIDVYTGKKLRALSPDPIAQYLLNPSERYDKSYIRGMSTPKPTRVEYINLQAKCIWIDEYAQV